MAKRSTLNSKLPKASSIRWSTGISKEKPANMSTMIGTDENGNYARKVYFKQGGSTKSAICWQVRYKFRRRYKPSVQKEKKKKAEWTDWTKWRTPIAFKPYNENGVRKAVAVNGVVPQDATYWRVGNKGYVKSSSYARVANWTKKLLADYDAVQFQFSVRAYHPNTRKHGNWTTQTLSVYRGPLVKDEVLVKRGGGGLELDFNYQSERECSILVSSVKDANGKEILKKKVNEAPTIDTARKASGSIEWYPYKRDGYTAGQIVIGVDNLTRKVEYQETLTVTAYVVTAEGAKSTKFNFLNSGFVYGKALADECPAPDVDITMDKETGVVTVKALKTSEFDGDYGGVSLSEIGCEATYELDGEAMTVEKFDIDKEDITVAASKLPDVLGTWKFRPPMNIPVTYHIYVKNEYNQWRPAEETATFEGRGYLLNGVTHSDICAAITYNASFEVKTTTNCSVALPIGRDLPFAVFGTGRLPTMTLQGNVITGTKKEGRQIFKYGEAKYAKELAKHLGVYILRGPIGEIFKVAVKNVNISYATKEAYTVSIEMEEVS